MSPLGHALGVTVPGPDGRDVRADARRDLHQQGTTQAPCGQHGVLDLRVLSRVRVCARAAGAWIGLATYCVCKALFNLLALPPLLEGLKAAQ